MQWMPAVAAAVVSGALLLLYPHTADTFFRTTASYGFEMITILPGVLVLMGLMTVLVSREFISRYLGKAAGIRGMILAFMLGTLPTGPLYVAFPFAAALKRKGAGTANLVIFLSAWACIKLPQELVELRFLGAEFMLARLVMTVIAVTGMALLMGRVLDVEPEPPGTD